MGEDSQMAKVDDSLPIKAALEPQAFCNKGRGTHSSVLKCQPFTTGSDFCWPHY